MAFFINQSVTQRHQLHHPFRLLFLFSFIWLCHSIQDLSSPTRDGTRDSCNGSTESYQLDCQGSPPSIFSTFSSCSSEQLRGFAGVPRLPPCPSLGTCLQPRRQGPWRCLLVTGSAVLSFHTGTVGMSEQTVSLCV